MNGRIIVISGPGGVGKGTVVSELMKRDDSLWLSRSWTTRAPRPGESPDAYHFASPEEFEAHDARGGFIEHANFLDYRQGSPLPDPPDGKDVVFEIDVQGAEQIAELFPEVLLIFIDTPSRSIQEERMRGRGDSEDRIVQRLQKAEEELARSKSLAFIHVINDELSRTVEEVEALIESHRSR
ncbi:MAG TPA: guanylate kinase [Microthrixaceae bacterium]|nr:guanylate kinase [Microthrixaceae bacterium]